MPEKVDIWCNNEDAAWDTHSHIPCQSAGVQGLSLLPSFLLKHFLGNRRGQVNILPSVPATYMGNLDRVSDSQVLFGPALAFGE